MTAEKRADTAVLLDLDGTLIDSTYHHALAWHRGFRQVGLTVPMWRLHRAIGMGGDRLVAAVTDDQIEERHGDEVREVWRREYDALRPEVEPLPGAVELVRTLHASPHRVALASSGDPEFTHDAVALLGIGDAVEVVTSSADVESSKPAADLLQVTLARMGGIRSALLVGDTPYDVESAARVGMPCLAVRTGGYSAAELRGRCCRSHRLGRRTRQRRLGTVARVGRMELRVTGTGADDQTRCALQRESPRPAVLSR